MMHQKESVSKFLAYTTSVMRVAVFLLLLLVSMSSIMHTARAASASSKDVNSTIHSAQRSLTSGRMDIPTTATTETAVATAVATATPMSYDQVDQTADVGNGPQVPSNQGQPITGVQDPQGPANFDGIDNNDESKVINVDDDTKIVLEQGSSVVVIKNDGDCDNDQEDHHHHNDHHHNDHHHHNNNNNNNNNNNHNNHSVSHVFGAGGVAGGAGGPGGGYPGMPFTGGDPRPLASK